MEDAQRLQALRALVEHAMPAMPVSARLLRQLLPREKESPAVKQPAVERARKAAIKSKPTPSAQSVSQVQDSAALNRAGFAESEKRNKRTRVETESSGTANKDGMEEKEILDLRSPKRVHFKENIAVSAQNHLRDRRSVVARMKKRNEESEREVKHQVMDRQLKMETMVKSSMDEFWASRRRDLNDARRQLRQQRESEKKAFVDREQSLVNFYKDRIAMMEEKIKELQTANEIERRAREQEQRKLLREKKAQLKESIRGMKDRLAVDGRDLHYRERDASRIMRP